ncbi:histidine kinase [Kineosporia rhizophila]|uniref:sensor histidine kinase n=1 Tax=Kineosporia sp. NBRC 101677 TaxID=3032197 RepID=UPI001E4683D5|nr:histidine kinase [Kineosporia sp. NBRC 101677]MCE0534128.1 histidine kinase [Kineosporia rhizophila]
MSSWVREQGLQVLATVGVSVAGLATVRPIGATGPGLVIAVLLPLCCLALAARHLPVIRPDLAFPWLATGILASIALIATSDQGTAYLFTYFLVGHAGVRLEARRAVPLAVAAGLSGAAAFAVAPVLPWPVGLTLGLPVLIGLARRSRQEATQAALAAAQAGERAARAEAQAAVLAERARIARDVHDVLAHSLAGINMQLELADALLDTGDLDRVRQANDKAHSLVRESLQQAQWTVHALREDALPLVDSLTAMIESSGHRDALTVHGDVGELPAQVVQNLLRIAQESLTNAARHAPGAPVRVELRRRAADVVLTINNGRVVAPVSASPGSGMGLIGMRERVALLGGVLEAGPITAADTADWIGGWRVTAVVPLEGSR